MKSHEVDLMVLITMSACCGINLRSILTPDFFSVLGLILSTVSVVIFTEKVLRRMEC